jgi:5-methylcytosine-specific restriction endonuclease McrA
MALSKAVRENVFRKFGGCCAYCGSCMEYKQMQVDHYYPQCKAKFYKNRFKIDVHAEANLMPACRRCNHYKRARTPKQFRTLMQGLHERLESIYILKVAVDFGMATIKPFDGSFHFEREAVKQASENFKIPTTAQNN